MRVPANPWTKVTSVSGNSAKSEDEQSDQNPFIVPMQSRKPPQDPILTARLKEAIVAEKENQTPAAPNPMSDPWTADGLPNMGFHKSRERARRPAVLRLVERKQAQKEKERERDRKARAKSSETIRSSTNNIKFGAGLSSTSTSAFSCNADQGLDTACVNDKLGEKHRRFSSNDVPSHSELMQNGLGSRRCASSSRLASQERTEILTKTYIRIGPGKPAQIREHSPSKSPSPPFARKPSLAEEDESDLSSFEARLQREKSSSSSPPYSRSSSPAKSSGLLFKFDARPLKSTGLLKDISTPEGETSSSSGSSAKPQERKRKRSYITEKTINIGLAPERPRRSASEHNLNSHRKSSSSSSPTNSTIHESKSFSVESSPRCSTDREFHPNSPSSSTSSSSKATTASFSSSFSTTSSKFGGSSDSVSSDSSADSHLSQRRKSLERRFQSRSSRLSSTPERKPAPGEVPPSSSPASSASSGFSSASSRLLYNLSSGYRYHRAAVSASASNKPRRFSQDHTSQKSSCKPSSRLSSRSTNGTTEQPAPSRKISLPPTCYEDPDRSVASAKRFVPLQNMPSFGGGSGDGCSSSSSSWLGQGNSLKDYGHLSNFSSSFSSFTSVQSSPGSFPPYPSPVQQSSRYTMKMSQKRSFVKSGDSGLAGMDFHFKSEHVLNVRDTPKAASTDSDIFSTLSPASSQETGEEEQEVISYLQFDKEDDTKTPKVCRRHKTLPVVLRPKSNNANVTVNLGTEGGCQETGGERSVNDMLDIQSVSTVSGSGMNFFRKFVQKKKQRGDEVQSGLKPPDTDEDRESQARFRREVLIERLVSDALSLRSETESSSCSNYNEDNWNELLDRPIDLGDIQDALSTISSAPTNARSSLNLSSVSGTGLRFLRNYIRKKKAAPMAPSLANERDPAFNGVPVPYPPRDDFYGPAYLLSTDDMEVEDKRLSIASTIANLLNESFNSDDDSELQHLDWHDDWREDQATAHLGELALLANQNKCEDRTPSDDGDTVLSFHMDSKENTPTQEMPTWNVTEPDVRTPLMDTCSRGHPSNSLEAAANYPWDKKSAQEESNAAEVPSFVSLGCPPLAKPELDLLDDEVESQGSSHASGKLPNLETFDLWDKEDPPIMANVRRRTPRKPRYLKKIDDGARWRNASSRSLLSASSQNSSDSDDQHFVRSGEHPHNRVLKPSPSAKSSSSSTEISCSNLASLAPSSSTPSPHPGLDCLLRSPDPTSRNRLVSFWHERVAHPEVPEAGREFQRSISDRTRNSGGPTSFRPVFPTYYKPETQDIATERIQAFVKATRQAAQDSNELVSSPDISAPNAVETKPCEAWQQNRAELQLLKALPDTPE